MDGSMKHADTIKKMSLKEKVALGSGLGYWRTKPLPRLQVPSIFLADGPHGLRKQTNQGDHLGLSASVKTTCFPTASALAASFDVDLLQAVGDALGKEALATGVNIILGPGVNMKRNPLCGRNFEYYSEDPYLSGKLAAAWIRGVQAHGVGVSLKHFACNNQETGRLGSDSLVDQRALREYYLPAFEMAVKEADPATLMCAYNKVNGTYCSDNRVLLTDILREEWGFSGLVMTDWGAMNDRVQSIKAGLDLEMPDSKGRFDREVIAAVQAGDLAEALVDQMADRVLALVERCTHQEAAGLPGDLFHQHHQLAREVAAACAVLLKNEGDILPLTAGEPLTVIGAFADTPRYQGTGSSQVNPTRLSSLLEGLAEHGVAYRYAQGYRLTDEEDPELAQEALALAQEGGTLVLCIGLTELYESEGFDRTTLALPRNQTALMETLHRVNPNIVVLLTGGAPMAMPWLHQARAVLLTHLGGQAGGLAAADVLLGIKEPGGRLAESYPRQYDDVISSSYYTKTPQQVPYYESMFAGYRYFDSAGIPVAFPFGHGLSYTRFSWRDLRLVQKGTYDYEARLFLKNTGERAGAEVVQLYVAPQTGGVYRPVHELKGFQKVFLQPGEETEVTLPLNARSFAFYNESAKEWQVEEGMYVLHLGASSRDIRLSAELLLPGVKAAKSSCDPWYYDLKGVPGKQQFESIYGPYKDFVPSRKGTYHLDNNLLELAQDSRLCRILYGLIKKSLAWRIPGTADDSNPEFKMMLNTVVTSPVRALVLFRPGILNIHQVQGLVDLANGQLRQGLARLLRLKK